VFPLENNQIAFIIDMSGLFHLVAPTMMGFAQRKDLEGWKKKLKAKPEKISRIYKNGPHSNTWYESPQVLPDGKGDLSAFPALYHLIYMESDFSFAEALLEAGFDISHGCPSALPDGQVIQVPWVCIAAKLHSVRYLEWFISFHGATIFKDSYHGNNVFHYLAYTNRAKYGPAVTEIVNKRAKYGRHVSEAFDFLVDNEMTLPYVFDINSPFDPHEPTGYTGRSFFHEVVYRLVIELDFSFEIDPSKKVDRTRWLSILHKLILLPQEKDSGITIDLVAHMNLEFGNRVKCWTEPRESRTNAKYSKYRIYWDSIQDGTVLNLVVNCVGGHSLMRFSNPNFDSQIAEVLRLLKEAGATHFIGEDAALNL